MTDSLAQINTKGAFKRSDAFFRDTVSADHETYKPESGRYTLIVNNACPWANRCVAVRALKGLEGAIDIVVTHPTWQRTRPENPDDQHCGWIFYDSQQSDRKHLVPPSGTEPIDAAGCDPWTITEDPIVFVRDVYERYGNGYTGVNSVPILFDKKTNSIVNNESSEIIRILTREFDEFATGSNADLDLYPEVLRAEIDAANSWIYDGINNGVYKCGFARSQEAYNYSVNKLFESLDRLEGILSESRFVCGGNSSEGSRLTEADVRLYMTLARFDEVYVVYFKTNKKRIVDYPNILNYCRDMHQLHEGTIGSTINMDHIKTHYFSSHAMLNPYSVIPVGPNFLKDLLKTPEGRTTKK